MHRLVLVPILFLFVIAPSRAQIEDEDPRKPSAALMTEASRLIEPAFLEGWGAPSDWNDHQIDVLRAGLYHADPQVARRAALSVQHSWLDHLEQRRVVDILMDEACRSSHEDFEEFRFCLGADDVPALFSKMAIEPRTDTSFYLGKIHVIVHAEHIVVGLRWFDAENPKLRFLAYETLSSALGYDDSHRAETGAALSRLLGLGSAPRFTSEGLNPDLAAMLRVLVINQPDLTRLPELESRLALLRNWLLRWLADSEPAPQDLDLLRDLSEKFRGEEEDGFEARGLTELLIALGRCRSPAAGRLIQDWRRRGSLAALALSTRDGDEEARKEAMSRARERGFFVVFLSLAPELGVEIIRETLRRGPVARKSLMESFQDFDQEVRRTGLAWVPAALEPLRRDLEILASKRPLEALTLALLLPDALSKKVVGEVLASLLRRAQEDPDRVEKGLVGTGEGSWKEDRIGVLAALQPEAFRELMRAWLASGNATHRNFAARALLHLGDPESGPALIAYLEEDPDPTSPSFDTAEDRGPVHLLAKSPGPEVEAYLRERSLPGQAALAGIPWHVADWMSSFLDEPGSASAAVQERIDAGDWPGVVLQLLEDLDASEDLGSYLPSLRDLTDERLRSFLRRLQNRRSTELYTRATGQLALMGDEVARSGLWDGIYAGRYGWLDNLDEEILSNGYDPETMSYWIDELRTQCCRINTSSGTMMDLFRTDIDWTVETRNHQMTSHSFAHLYFGERPDRERIWSDFLGRFLVVVRD